MPKNKWHPSKLPKYYRAEPLVYICQVCFKKPFIHWLKSVPTPVCAEHGQMKEVENGQKRKDVLL